MSYQDVFVLFWEQVKESVQEGRFAKLTMAKTVGKPNLRNIFVLIFYSIKGYVLCFFGSKIKKSNFPFSNRLPKYKKIYL